MHRYPLPRVVVLCAISLALTACAKPPPADPRTEAPLVRVATVEESAAASRSFTGVVSARVQSDLGFRVSGKVLERTVDAGQAVKRGQVVMRIDPADLRLVAHAQDEAVAAARARAQQTANDEARYRDLRGTGAISASAYDQAKSVADAAKAELSAATAQAAVARNANRYSELTADADGVVVETLAEPGQVVAPGQVVVRIAHAGSREAIIQLPETLRPAIGSAALATRFGDVGVVAPSRLRQLAESADRLTRTFEARYVLEGPLASAPLGSTVTLKIADESAAGLAHLQVPIGSLYDAGTAPGVWVISGTPTKVAWQPVSIVRLADDRAHITAPLKSGDQVVSLGAHLLREGELVRVADHAGMTSPVGSHP